MSFTTETRQFQTLLTTTHSAYLDTMIHDQVFNQHPATRDLFAKAKMINGGDQINQGILYGKNSTAQWYSGHQLLNVLPQEGHTVAQFQWKQGSVSVVYSGRELRLNKGSKTQITNIIKAKQAQADASLMDMIATGIYSDGTGSANLQLTGFAAMNETTPGTAAYANVPITNAQWRNQAIASVGAAATNLLPNMRTLWNNCSNGKGQAGTTPDKIYTTQTVIEAYEALHVSLLRYASAKEGDLGFQGFKYKGATVEYDPYCTSGELHMVNTRHVMLVIHPDANLSLSAGGFVKPANQDDFVAQILFMGQLVTNNRRKGGKLAGIS
jgi:hypothetical protein